MSAAYLLLAEEARIKAVGKSRDLLPVYVVTEGYYDDNAQPDEVIGVYLSVESAKEKVETVSKDSLSYDHKQRRAYVWVHQGTHRWFYNPAYPEGRSWGVYEIPLLP